VAGPGTDQPIPDRDVDVDRSSHSSGPRRWTTGRLSVVIPLFNEAENVPALWQRVRAVLEPLGSPFEVVFVNDGSRDATPPMIDALHAEDPRVVVVHLSRNFGHQQTISAGLEQARGRAVIVMDGDLQDPPELIPELVRCWRGGFDVVYAVRRSPREGPTYIIADVKRHPRAARWPGRASLVGSPASADSPPHGRSGLTGHSAANPGRIRSRP
jgi:glycosyltransferase involved in cell wall biosynthesis